MSDIKVSVICEVYNHEKYLRKCLDSLINQETSFDYEIIVNDDCSTDSSADIIREYAAKYPSKIVPLLQEENLYSKGVDIPFEIMIPIAKGDYICLCEGDDFWTDSTKLQRQYDALESSKNAAFSVHKVRCVLEDGSKSERVIPSPEIENKITKNISGNLISNEDFAKLVLCGDYPFQTSSYFIRKELCLKVSENKLSIGRLTNADYILLFLAIMGGDVVYFSNEMSSYRLSSQGSWTNSHPVDDMEEIKSRFDGAMKAEIIVNEAMGKSLDQLFKASFARHILAWSDVFPKEAKKSLKENGVDFGIIRKFLKPKYSIYYMLLYTCPKLHTILKKWGRRAFK